MLPYDYNMIPPHDLKRVLTIELVGLTFQNAPPQSIPAAQNYVCIQLYKTAAGWNVICT